MLVALLQRKGLVEPSELQSAIERLQQGEQRLGDLGRRVVAHAWRAAEMEATAAYGYIYIMA